MTVALRLLPREDVFFDLFNQAAQNNLEAARSVKALVDDYTNVEEKAAAVKALEDKGDAITHEIIARLNRTFVTPFDREDILELAKQVDNVLDWTEAGAARLAIYRIPSPTPEIRELAHINLSIAQAIVEGIAALRKLDKLVGPIREINRLENLADHVQRDAVARLFAGSDNPIDILKWKEIYETLEEATDQGEDVANVLDSIYTKNR